jgi:PmbA protein
MHSYLHGHPALVQAVRKLEQLNPDEFELFFQHRTSTKIDSKNQKTDSLSRSEDVGLAVRLIKDKRLGFSFTTSLENEAIHRAIESAFEIATFMPEDPFNGFYSFGSAIYPHVDNFDPTGIAAPMSRKIELARDLEALCKKTDPRVTTVRSASVSENISKIHLVDSNGEHIEHQSTLYSASITCKAEEGGDSQMGGDFGFSNFLDSLDINKVGRQAAQWATELLQAKGAPTMQCPAIFRNSVVADLIDFLSASFSAEQIDKGKSMLADKRGQMVFSERVHLIDDGLMPGGLATSPFDGEGVPCRKTILVDGGFVAGRLSDCYYGRKFSTEPTGSSGRGIKGPPSIGFSNLYLQAGRKTAEQLQDGISKGILITDLMGVHTANPITGDFSLGASGILIENGKLTRPVKGFAVAGNVLEVFRRITDIGQDLRFFGNVGAPSICVSEISISGV